MYKLILTAILMVILTTVAFCEDEEYSDLSKTNIRIDQLYVMANYLHVEGVPRDGSNISIDFTNNSSKTYRKVVFKLKVYYNNNDYDIYYVTARNPVKANSPGSIVAHFDCTVTAVDCLWVKGK